MVYLLALNVILAIGMLLFFQAMSRFHRQEASSSDVARVVVTVFPVLTLLNAPLVIEILKQVRIQSEGVNLGEGSLAAMLTAAGAAWGLVGFTIRIWKQRSTNPSFKSIGANVLSWLVCAYMAFVVVDHFTFYQNRADAGVLSWSYFRHMESVTDVHCESDTMIVSGIDTDEATYRCPNLFMLDRYSSTPFVPWPSYSEGTSHMLGVAILKMHNEAIKVE